MCKDGIWCSFEPEAIVTDLELALMSAIIQPFDSVDIDPKDHLDEVQRTDPKVLIPS